MMMPDAITGQGRRSGGACRKPIVMQCNVADAGADDAQGCLK